MVHVRASLYVMCIAADNHLQCEACHCAERHVDTPLCTTSPKAYLENTCFLGGGTALISTIVLGLDTQIVQRMNQLL